MKTGIMLAFILGTGVLAACGQATPAIPTEAPAVIQPTVSPAITVGAGLTPVPTEAPATAATEPPTQTPVFAAEITVEGALITIRGTSDKNIPASVVKALRVIPAVALVEPILAIASALVFRLIALDLPTLEGYKIV